MKIPQHLDNRRLYLGLPPEELVLAVLPALIGFASGHNTGGLAVSVGGVLGVQFMKRALRQVSLPTLLYRYLPWFDPALPPSHWHVVGG